MCMKCMHFHGYNSAAILMSSGWMDRCVYRDNKFYYFDRDHKSIYYH